MERKIALLTGASKGIGFATAQALAKRGYDLIINSRNTSDSVTKLQNLGINVEGVDGSLGD
ncbi:SDR family NAD(P)-dependent oxidoreductase, partial [Ekhidna sp.]